MSDLGSMISQTATGAAAADADAMRAQNFQRGLESQRYQQQTPIANRQLEAKTGIDEQTLAEAKLNALAGMLPNVKDEASYQAVGQLANKMGIDTTGFFKDHPNYGDGSHVQAINNTLQAHKANAAQQQVAAEAGSKQMAFIGSLLGATNDQTSFDKAKETLKNQGIDTSFLPDTYNQQYIDKMRYLGATPSAQLSAAMQTQQMGLRGKIAGLDNYSPSGQLNTAPQSINAPQANSASTHILNDALGQTPAEKVAAMLPADNALLPEPIKEPTETTKNYQARLAAWKSDPDIAAHLEEKKTAGKDTIKYNNTIAADAKQAINMHQTIATMQAAQQQFQAGALAPAQGMLIKYARALGVPVTESQIATLSNQQEFTKLQNDIIGQAAKAEGGASRLESAFSAIKSSNPNIGMEPESLNALFNIMDTKAGEITTEQQAWNEAKKANPKLSGAEFLRDYTAQRVAAQEKAGGTLPGYKGNPNTPSSKNMSVPNGWVVKEIK